MKRRTGMMLVFAALPCGCGNSGSGAQADGPSPPEQETCNFTDDDGDGVVDEGFAWVVEPATVIHRVEKFSAVGPAWDAGDGTWLVAGTDAVSEPGDQFFVLRVDARGNVIDGPAYVPIPHCSCGTPVVTIWGSKVVAMTGTRTWEDRPPCPAEGCPILLSVFEPDLTLSRTEEAPIAALQQMSARGISCTEEACFVLVGLRAEAGLVRISMQTFQEEAYLDLSEHAYFVRGCPATEGAIEVVHIHDEVVVWKRVATADFSLLESKSLVEGASKIREAAATPDGGVALAYEDRESEPLLVRLDADRNPVTAPVEVATWTAMMPVGSGLVYVGRTTEGLALTARISRLTLGLELVSAPNNPAKELMYCGKATLASTGDGILLISANYDGQAIEARRIACDPGAP